MTNECDILAGKVARLEKALAHAVQYDWLSNQDEIPEKVSTEIIECLQIALGLPI